MDISTLALDADKCENGVWVDLTDNARIKIAYIGNKAFNKHIEKNVTNQRALAKLQKMGDQDALKQLSDVVAETCILDWDGFSEGDIEIPYSKEKCLEFMTDPKWRQIRDVFLEQVQDHTHFRASEIKATGKKSQK